MPNSLPNSLQIAYALRELRQNKGLSQEELSSLAGLDRTYISMLERGKRKPSLETIAKFSSALSMQPWELVKAICQHPRGGTAIPCYQLIFTSRATVEVTIQMLLELMQKAEQHNNQNSISGLLLYANNRFIQLIEGRHREPVRTLFSKIKKDPRHTNVNVITAGEGHEMHMSAWVMGFSLPEGNGHTLRGKSFYIGMDEAMNICQSMPGMIGQTLCQFIVENQ